MTTRRELFAISAAALATTSLAAHAQQNPSSPEEGVMIKQIRNATLHITYGGSRFLIDPMLADRHAFPGFEGTLNSEQRNPMVHLPMTMAEILNVDAVIVTHLHDDHWDEAARNLLPKNIPLFAQNAADAEVIRGQGFSDVRLLSEGSSFNGVQLIKTDGRHGTEAHYDAIGAALGETAGVVFKTDGLKTLYLAGDTIWHAYVIAALAAHKPDAIILNTGYAMIAGMEGGIIMGTDDVLKVHHAAPEALLIATHMEAINHCTLTRAALRDFAKENGFIENLMTPADGETVSI